MTSDELRAGAQSLVNEYRNNEITHMELVNAIVRVAEQYAREYIDLNTKLIAENAKLAIDVGHLTRKDERWGKIHYETCEEFNQQLAERDAEIERLAAEVDVMRVDHQRTLEREAKGWSEQVAQLRRQLEEARKEVDRLRPYVDEVDQLRRGAERQSKWLAERDAEIERHRATIAEMQAACAERSDIIDAHEEVMREVAAELQKHRPPLDGDLTLRNILSDLRDKLTGAANGTEAKTEPRAISDEEGELWVKRKIEEALVCPQPVAAPSPAPSETPYLPCDHCGDEAVTSEDGTFGEEDTTCMSCGIPGMVRVDEDDGAWFDVSENFGARCKDKSCGDCWQQPATSEPERCNATWDTYTCVADAGHPAQHYSGQPATALTPWDAVWTDGAPGAKPHVPAAKEPERTANLAGDTTGEPNDRGLPCTCENPCAWCDRNGETEAPCTCFGECPTHATSDATQALIERLQQERDAAQERANTWQANSEELSELLHLARDDAEKLKIKLKLSEHTIESMREPLRRMSHLLEIAGVK